MQNQILLEIIGAVMFSIYITEISNIGNRIGFKPFNCALCLAVWTALLLHLLPPLAIWFIVLFTPGVLSPLIIMQIRKPWNQ
jgi:hypothetical protein